MKALGDAVWSALGSMWTVILVSLLLGCAITLVARPLADLYWDLTVPPMYSVEP